MAAFDVQCPIGSNHRTAADSVRTSFEPQRAPGGLKGLAQHVMQDSSTSNLPSNSHRTKEFEPSNFEPANTIDKFEGKNQLISPVKPLVVTASGSVSDLPHNVLSAAAFNGGNYMLSNIQ